jgi:tetratricopeptide (TPR) repeat protein
VNWRLLMSWLLLLLSVGIIAFMFLRTDQLTEKVQNQQEEIERQKGLQAQYAQGLARRQSQLRTLGRTLRVNESFMAQTSLTAVARACPPPQQRQVEGWTPRENNLCSLLSMRTDAFTDLLGRYLSLGGQRAAAESPDDFAQIGRAYASLLERARSIGLAGEWQARMLEGIAYSEYRSGRLREAVNHVSEAIRLDPASPTAASTALKIACRGPMPATSVRQRYAESLNRIRRPGPTDEPRAIDENVRDFAEDPELRLECADADLPPPEAATQSG